MGRVPSYSQEFRWRVVELLESSGKWVPGARAGLGVSPQTLRSRRGQTEIGQGRQEGLASDERDELRRLRREKANHPVKAMCRVLGVSRSGFCAWQARPPSERAMAGAWLTEQIQTIHAETRGVCGAPRVHAELAIAHQVRVGCKRVERLMAQAGLSGLVARRGGARRCGCPVSGSPTISSPATFARRPERVVGRRHHLSAHLGGLALPRRRPRRVLAADRRMGRGRPHALPARRRRPSNGDRPPPTRPRADLTFGSGQPVRVGQACASAGIARSMGSRGDCYDNAVAESFFATLKKELIHRRS